METTAVGSIDDGAIDRDDCRCTSSDIRIVSTGLSTSVTTTVVERFVMMVGDTAIAVEPQICCSALARKKPNKKYLKREPV